MRTINAALWFQRKKKVIYVAFWIMIAVLFAIAVWLRLTLPDDIPTNKILLGKYIRQNQKIEQYLLVVVIQVILMQRRLLASIRSSPLFWVVVGIFLGSAAWQWANLWERIPLMKFMLEQYFVQHQRIQLYLLISVILITLKQIPRIAIIAAVPAVVHWTSHYIPGLQMHNELMWNEVSIVWALVVGAAGGAYKTNMRALWKALRNQKKQPPN